LRRTISYNSNEKHTLTIGSWKEEKGKKERNLPKFGEDGPESECFLEFGVDMVD